jgi:hypothetical protein
MSIFTTILEKLGLQKPAEKPAAKPTAKPPAGTSGPVGMPRPMAPQRPAPMAMVDVVSKLENLAGDNPGLDWKVSIVDLLKLLGIDSSLSARKELAAELKCPPDLIGGDYAKMNVWLHETVLKKIADNGGNIPASLLKK